MRNIHTITNIFFSFLATSCLFSMDKALVKQITIINKTEEWLTLKIPRKSYCCEQYYLSAIHTPIPSKEKYTIFHDNLYITNPIKFSISGTNKPDFTVDFDNHSVLNIQYANNAKDLIIINNEKNETIAEYQVHK